MKKETSFAAIDFEYLSSRQFPCAVGMVIVRSNVIVQEFYTLIDPPQEGRDEEIFNRSGITYDMCSEAPAFPEVWSYILAQTDGLPFVIHNRSTEPSVIRKTCAHYGLEHDEEDFLFIDTMDYTEGDTLDSCCRQAGIDTGRRHHALDDARACACLFIHLCGGKLVAPKPKEYKPLSNSGIAAHSEERRVKAENPQIYQAPDLNVISCKETPFYGKRVLITGTFDRFPDRVLGLGAVLHSLGATIEKSPGYVKRIDVLVAGSKAGSSKLANAKADGKTVISEEELYEILRKEGKLRN